MERISVLCHACSLMILLDVFNHIFTTNIVLDDNPDHDWDMK